MRRETITTLYDEKGKVRGYRVRVDAGTDTSGKRRQVMKTFPTQKAAKAWADETKTSAAKGQYVARSATTVDEHLDTWLKSKHGVKASTLANYRHALKPARKLLGARKVQTVTAADVDTLVAQMLDGTLRHQGTKGAPLSPRAVRLTLTVLSMALDRAEKDGLVPRNVVKTVERPSDTRTERKVWEAADAPKFLAAVSDDRLAGAWHLSLYGLRRGEVLGLRWSDVDLDAAVVTVRQNRVLVDGEVLLQDTKTVAGEREVPLTADAVAVLRRMRRVQATERLAAGSAYQDSGLVVVDALGGPVAPRWYSDRFQALCRAAGVPVVRLHDARHAFGSYLVDQGVPVTIVSKMLGHASVDITTKVYLHALQDHAHDRVREALTAIGL